jgi:hypothetical protein
MDLVFTTILAAILSVSVGYSVEQLAYGQENMTEGNMTGANMTAASGNMTSQGTVDGNTTKGGVSGGLAVSDEGAPGKKSTK